MTTDDRVAGAAAWGFTPRQTQFLVLVAVQSGYCVRRQYEMFAGIRYGKNVRTFLDRTVARGLTRRFTLCPGRGHIYHVQSRRFYRAIGEEDNRHRRQASPAQIARKLMVLDYVLSQPTAEWYSTEQEKVALLVGRHGVAPDVLPRRVFRRDAVSTASDVRYFLHKLPIYVPAAGAPPHFVFLAIDETADSFQCFLREHAPLFRALPAWAVVAVGTTRRPLLEAAFDTFCAGVTGGNVGLLSNDLHWYFVRRRQVERGGLAQIPVADLGRVRDLRERFGTAAHEAQYASWCQAGEPGPAATTLTSRPAGTLIVESLLCHYPQFGSLPGVV